MSKYIFILLLFATLSSIGQVNFQKGYVLLQSGDTLRGEIDNKDWGQSPEIIRFRKNKDAKLQKINPYQCQEFCIETGFVFRSVQTALYLTKENYDKPTFAVVADTTVFMEVIAKDKLTLFEFIEKGEKSRFFIQKNNIKIEQLIYHSYYSATYIIHHRQYQRQLAELTSDSKTDKIAYERNALIKFVNKFNGLNIVAKEKKNQKPLVLRLGIGFAFHQPLSIVRLSNNYEIVNFGSNTKPAVGFNVSFPFSKKFNSFAFDFSTLYSPYTGNKKSGDSYLSTQKVHTNNLYLSLGTRYMFYTKHQLRPFIGIGAGINEHFGDYIIKTDGKKISIPIRPQNGEFEFNIHPARLYAKIGLHINKKIETEFRLDKIPKYNLRTDAKAPLLIYNLMFYWTIND